MSGDEEPNPLVSTQPTSESSPQVQLHPLVLLTISDYTTRHILRQNQGPISGAILGQQNGREVTMEVAFECKATQTPDGEVQFDEEWFASRLEQFKDVYKSPALDLVGWFTLGSKAGPQPHHLPIQQQLMSAYNEAALLLLFHPDNVYDRATSAGKLPLAIYETQLESASALGKDAGTAMEVDGQAQGKTLKFRELEYTVETGEAEMISVDFVARGGGNATAVDGSKKQPTQAESEASSTSSKGKGKVAESKERDTSASDTLVLSAEDEELLSSITAKTNAIRMLHTRIELLNTYLSSLQPSYLSDPTIPPSQQSPPADSTHLPIDHTILRHLLSLLARLPILAPPSTAQFLAEAEEARSDTALIHLLSSITGSVSEAKEMGRKVAVVDNAKHLAQMRLRGSTSFGDAEAVTGGKAGGAEGFLQSMLGGGDGRGTRKNWA